MTKKKQLIGIIAAAVAVPALIAAVVATADESTSTPARPEGPCDIYAAGGAPCAAAHSSTRALYAAYDGPLYQVMRQSDGQRLDIGVVKPSAGDAGGYADAAAQDAFCANTTCWVTILYDQSGNGNHLYQAPRGGFSGSAMGGFNNVPVADWAPVTIMGHKVYGLFIAPGMGLRWNDTKGTAVDDQAEGQYWVISGHHYNTGCCFDYGNAETDSRDDGDGTMETTYFGNGTGWYYGQAPGPWIMTDQENNLVGCVNPDPQDKFCRDLPSISWRFVTATADGEPHHWRSMGGDAQNGELITMYDGQRIQNSRNSYDPMRKQGAILLGNGGDNSVGSAGTFYEAAMTAAGTFPTVETNQAIQANVVAAGYDVQRLAITPSDKVNAPTGVQTFAPKSTGYTTVTFVNTTGEAINDLELGIEAPRGWKVNVIGTSAKTKKADFTVEPGQTVAATFAVTSGRTQFNGDLVAVASWKNAAGKTVAEKAVEKVRNVNAVKINEYSDNFIELFNAGNKTVNISGWSITTHAINIPYFSSINIPAGKKLAPKQFYVLGLSNSGLAVDAAKGDKTIYVRDITGIEAGDEIEIGTGRNAEKRKVAAVIVPEVQPAPGAPFAAPVNFGPTTLWQPLPDGPVITIPAGSTNVPVTSTAGFKVGDKIALGYGATYPAVSNTIEKYEVATVTEVGKPGTQAWLAFDAKPGDTNIKVSSVQNISVGDKIRLDIDSEGHGIETVTVKSVGTASSRRPSAGPMPIEEAGTGLELEEPLKYAHSANMPFSCRGTGITFEPATRFDHSSNEPVLALVYAIELDSPLASDHAIDDVVLDAKVVEKGYHYDAEADQMYGGPAFGQRGNITLRNRKGLIVDALNYGGVVDPWLSEGYHGEAGAGADGNFAPAVMAARRRGFTPSPVQIAAPKISAGRYPDGADSDDNKADFRTQSTISTIDAAAAGSNTISVSDSRNLKIGQVVFFGAGENRETVKIAVINPARTEVTKVNYGGREREITSRIVDITLAGALKNDHPAGESIISGDPTPGHPNNYK